MIDQGMVYAVESIEKYNAQGLDGIAKIREEMKKKGIYKLPYTFSDDAADKIIKELSNNLYNTMISVFFMTLEDSFDFGDKLVALKEAFDKNIEDIMDLDAFGEHYVSLQDFTREMNDKYGFAFEESRVAYCQKLQDEDDARYHYAKIESIIDRLERDGYPAAALHLKKQIER